MTVDAISADDLACLPTRCARRCHGFGQALDKALVEPGWLEMLEEMPAPQYLWCSGCSAKPAHTRR
jgi:hypothetical protein